MYRLLHRGVLPGVLLIAVIVAEGSARAQSDTELKALNQRVIELYRVGKVGETVPIAERYAEAMKARHGPNRPEYAVALNKLARLLEDTNRLAEAEPLMRRALAIARKGR